MPRAIAAALTPLRDGGADLDLDALEPYLAFLAGAGVDGVLLLGTTGEGMHLSLDERERLSSTQCSGPLPVIAHCGAQTTADDRRALPQHAAATGADGVAVIAPPYFLLDETSLLAHFAAAARACAPTAVLCVRARAASGYAIPPGRDRAAARVGRQPRRA